MNYKKYIVPAICLMLVGAGGCKKVVKSDAATAHEAWVESLNDSVAATRAQIETGLAEIDSLHQEVGRLLESFDRVDDPRQVEPYTIASGWKEKYPLTSTGVIARLTEGEQLELIAVLKGGTFEHLTVSSPDMGERQTDVVPYDQALNYRAGGLNTVAFTGARADSVAQLIAEAAPGTVTVGYGKSFANLAADQQAMIARTWKLYDAHRRAQQLERSLPILNEKIKILEARLSKEN